MSPVRDEFVAVLEVLAADRALEFGKPGARVDQLSTVNGPFSSVRRVRIHTDRTTHAYIKILKPRTAGAEELARTRAMLEREFAATRALYETLRQDDSIGAVRPMAWIPELRAIVTEEVPGRPLTQVLAEATVITDPLLSVAARIGQWARSYQSTVPTGGTIALAAQRAYVDARLQVLEGRVLSAGGRRRVLDQFDELAATMPTSEWPAVAIHADLSPGNLIVDDRGRVTVLDFTMAKSGTQHHDLSHVYFHLALLAERHRHRAALFHGLQAAMLHGYDPRLSDGDPLFRMMLMQHGVCHLALLAERRVPLLDLPYRWFLRRRWKTCEQIHRRQSGTLVA